MNIHQPRRTLNNTHINQMSATSISKYGKTAKHIKQMHKNNTKTSVLQINKPFDSNIYNMQLHTYNTNGTLIQDVHKSIHQNNIQSTQSTQPMQRKSLYMRKPMHVSFNKKIITIPSKSLIARNSLNTLRNSMPTSSLVKPRKLFKLQYKPVVKKTTKPVIKKITKPVVKKTTKPVVKKITKPVVKKIRKPVVKKTKKKQVDKKSWFNIFNK
jgi:hypothetical protein